MKLDALSLKERISLCRRAAAAAVGRLNLLGQAVDPEDGPLRRLFEMLAHDEERRLAEVSRLDVPTGEVPAHGLRDLDPIIAGFFPSLTREPGEGFVDRETGSYFAECLEEESVRFYRALAEQASDEESRAFFHQSEQDQESHLNFVRNVLL